MYKTRKHLSEIKHDSYANVPEEFGPGWIDCSLGINPFGFPEGVGDSMGKFGADIVNNYPHGDTKLKNAIIGYWSENALLCERRIELACGSMDAITKINKMFIDKGTAVLGHSPQFPDFGMDVEGMGGIYETVDMSEENGKFDGVRFMDGIEERHAFCYIDNPNNPTGQIIPLEVISEIAKKAASMGVCVVVDEAYGDFMEKANSAVNLLDDLSNIMVLKSFSKGFGMAGMRIGYAMGSIGLMDVYRKISIPFCVTGIGTILAIEALKDEGFLDESRKKIAKAKKRIIGAMDNLGSLETSPTVPIMTLTHRDKEVDLYRELLKVQVLSVSGENFGGLGKNSVRFRIGKDADLLLERLRLVVKNWTEGN
ncbi:MAG TPA: aminotransferase class I/II-fold pyridoxal phosphate-dependent enzyme [Clostridia bacterium]|nr:aminotransferase class I/II-fold pyridoxal phosphate-dependent enzyme [Clostridia bacterium]